MISLAKDQMWALGLDSICVTVCSFRFGRPLYRIHRLAGGRHLGVRDPGHPADRRLPIDRLVDDGPALDRRRPADLGPYHPAVPDSCFCRLAFLFSPPLLIN